MLSNVLFRLQRHHHYQRILNGKFSNRNYCCLLLHFEKVKICMKKHWQLLLYWSDSLSFSLKIRLRNAQMFMQFSDWYFNFVFCTLPLRKLKPQILFRKGTIRRFGNWLADRQDLPKCIKKMACLLHYLMMFGTKIQILRK